MGAGLEPPAAPTETMGMRRRDPILWVTGLILAVTWTVALLESLEWIDRPFPGFLVLENRVVASAGLAHWPALEEGKIYQHEVVAVDGVPLTDASSLRSAAASLPVGTPVRYRFRRGEHEFERVVATRRFEALDFALLFGSMLLCGGVVGITALLIRFLRRDRLATSSFCLLAIAAIWGASAADLYGPYRLFRLHALCETLLFAGALHMALVFPHSARLVERWPGIVKLPYGFAALLGVANQLGLHDPDLYVLTHQIAVWAFGVGLFVLIASHLRWYLRPPSFEARQRVKVVAFGAIAALSPVVFLALGNWITGRDAAQNAIAFSAILYPLSIGYAVLRHNLLEVDAFLRRSVSYALLTAVATIAYMGVAGGLDGMLKGSGAGATGLAGAGTFFLTFAALLLLRDRVQGGIDRIFFRSAYDFRRVVENVSGKLAGTADLGWIRREIERAVGEALHPDRLSLYLVREDELEPWGPGAEGIRDAASVAWLAEGEDAPFDVGEGGLVVPFRVDGELVAALALRRPRSGRLYSGEDRRLLLILANQGAVAIRNASALRELRDLNRDLEAKVEERTQELRQTQAQLVHREKMASVGQFVAGIAHELNNPLNFIQGNLFHLREYTETLKQTIEAYQEAAEEGEDAPRRMMEIRASKEVDWIFDDLAAVFEGCREGIERSTTLVRDLRTFSRLDQPERMLADLHDAIDSTVNLLRSKLIKVRVEKDYGDLPAVECIAGQLNQVLMNLIANAADALEDGGTIWIRTRPLGDDSVSVEVEDDGPGIDSAHMSRIFDPFFTTKEVGKGTGLGLSISYAIVQRHGGSLDVRSREGGGCVFRFVLPIQAPEGADVPTGDPSHD